MSLIYFLFLLSLFSDLTFEVINDVKGYWFLKWFQFLVSVRQQLVWPWYFWYFLVLFLENEVPLKLKINDTTI